MNNDHNPIEKSSQKQVQILPVSVDHCLSNCKTCKGSYYMETIDAIYRLDCKCHDCGHHG